MTVPLTVLKAVTLWPAVLASSLLLVALAASAPALPVLLAALMVAALLVAVMSGRFEKLVVVLFTGARVASPSERSALGSGLDGVGRAGLPRFDLFVNRRQHAGTRAARVLGGRSLVISRGLVDAVRSGRVTNGEVVAVVAQAVAVQRVCWRRGELAWLVVTSPWRVLRAVSREIGGVFPGSAIVRVAWSLRGLLAVACVVQAIAETRPAAGVTGAVVIGTTYLVPAAARAMDARTQVAGDLFVVDLGLGHVLAALLKRTGGPVTDERLRRLEQQRLRSDRSPRAPYLVQFTALSAFSMN